MAITSTDEALQAIADIEEGIYGDEGSVEREAIMNSLREFQSDLSTSPLNGFEESSLDAPEIDLSLTNAPFERPKSFSRGLKLGTRATAQGAAGLLGIVSDPIAWAMNLGLEAVNVDPSNRIPYLRKGVSDRLTAMGVPESETKTERIMSAIVEGGSAGAVTMGVGAIPAVASKSPLLARILTSPYEMIGGGTGAGGSQFAKEKGAGLAGQISAGIGASISLPAMLGGLSAIRNIATYFTKTSTGNRVGKKLNEIATEPTSAIKKLEEGVDIVPGSQQTTGVASADVGLLAAEARMRSLYPELFGVRLSQQNAARRAYLQSQIDELGDPEISRAYRNLVTRQMREEALEQGKIVDVQPVIDRMVGILKSSRGERDPVQKALPWILKRLKQIKAKGTTNEADRFYALRQDISDVIYGKNLDPKKSGWKLAKRELENVRNALDDAIEKVSPGYKAYLDEYARLSNRATQAERLIDFSEKGVVAGIDPISGREIFSQAKFKNLLKREKGQTGIKDVLTDEQMHVLTKISNDLDRGMTIVSPQVRSPGSNTPRDTIATGIGSLISGVLIRNRTMSLVAGSLSWVGKLTKGQQNDLMIEAMLDPKLAAMLMRNATVRDANIASRALWDKFLSLSVGSIAGMAAHGDRSIMGDQLELQGQIDELSKSVPDE